MSDTKHMTSPLIPPANQSRQDTPQPDIEDITGSALTTMRRLNGAEQSKNTREGRKRNDEQFEVVESSVSTTNNGGLTYLYSSVKHALKDNLNNLDFSRRLPEQRKQQLRYHISTHESEQSMIQECVDTPTMNFERRQSNQVEKALPFEYTRLQQSASSKSIKEATVIDRDLMIKSREVVVVPQPQVVETPCQIDSTQEIRMSNSRFYHTFNNDHQQATRQSMQSKESRKLDQSLIDPATPMFSSQKPTMFQSMQVPSATKQEDGGVRNPQIISRTHGLMKLNSSSSCQSLDHLRDEMLNLTIRRTQVHENPPVEPVLGREEKPKLVATKKSKAVGGSNSFSRTMKLTFGGSMSHQQSQYTSHASRILSPLSQKTPILLGSKLSQSTTPKLVKKQKRRPKSSTSTNTVVRSSKAAGVVHRPNSSEVSFNGPTASSLAAKKRSIQPPAPQKKLQLLSKQSRCPSSLSGGGRFTTISPVSRVCATLSPTALSCKQPAAKKKKLTVKKAVGVSQSLTHSTGLKTATSSTNNSKKRKRSLAGNLPSSQGSQVTLVNMNTLTSGTGAAGAATVGKATSIIRKGLQKKGQAITDKNEIVAMMLQEKKTMAAHIVVLKKEIIQTQKQAKATNDNNKQIEDDIVKVSELVNQKCDRNQHLQREVALAKRDVRQLHLDCEDLKQEKNRLLLKIEGEYELMDVVQRLIVNLKKQTNEVRREKERLQITVRGEQRKVLEVIAKRRELVSEESSKIYADYRMMQGVGGPVVGGGLSSQPSRSVLHTPKGQK